VKDLPTLETALTNIRKSRAMIGAYSFLRSHARASAWALVIPRYWLITRRPPGSLSHIVDDAAWRPLVLYASWWKGSRCLLIRTMLATCTNSSLPLIPFLTAKLCTNIQDGRSPYRECQNCGISIANINSSRMFWLYNIS